MFWGKTFDKNDLKSDVKQIPGISVIVEVKA